MTRTQLAIAFSATILTLWLPAPRAAAQAPPFFGGGGGIFDPEIDVVESGMLLDAQATVSADRKYVTLTPRVQSTQLVAIREFAFQTGAGGQGGQVGGPPQFGGRGLAPVGGGGAGGAAPRGGAGANNGAAQHPRSAKPYPSLGKARAPAGGSILEKPGMTLVSRVEPRSES